MKTLLLICLFLPLFAACSSTKVKPVEEKLDAKARLGQQEIGITEDEEAVVQESVAAEDELRRYQWNNYELERKLYAEREDLVRCRTELADPRLSGNKQMQAIPELELSKDISKVQQKFGLTENGRLRVVRRELFQTRLEKEQAYHESLSSLVNVLKGHRENCHRELGYARVQHGLPAERYMAEGYYGSEGNFIVTRAAEKNLDDAFRILASQKKRASSAVTEVKEAEVVVEQE